MVEGVYRLSVTYRIHSCIVLVLIHIFYSHCLGHGIVIKGDIKITFKLLGIYTFAVGNGGIKNDRFVSSGIRI